MEISQVERYAKNNSKLGERDVKMNKHTQLTIQQKFYLRQSQWPITMYLGIM